MGIGFVVGCGKDSADCEAFCDNLISQAERCFDTEASTSVEECTVECEANLGAATEGCTSEADAVLACGSEATVDCETGEFCEEELAALETCQDGDEYDTGDNW
jgi:hypothetical protein